MLEDVHQCLRLTFYADPDEACRLTQELERGQHVCHPVYDFMRRLLEALQATATRVVLDVCRVRASMASSMSNRLSPSAASPATRPMPSPWLCGQTSPSTPLPRRWLMRSACHPPERVR